MLLTDEVAQYYYWPGNFLTDLYGAEWASAPGSRGNMGRYRCYKIDGTGVRIVLRPMQSLQAGGHSHVFSHPSHLLTAGYVCGVPPFFTEEAQNAANG